MGEPQVELGIAFLTALGLEVAVVMWGSAPLSSLGGGPWSAGRVRLPLSPGLAWSFGVKLRMGASPILTAMGLATHGAPLVVAHRFQMPGWLWSLRSQGKRKCGYVCANLPLLAVRKLAQNSKKLMGVTQSKCWALETNP